MRYNNARIAADEAARRLRVLEPDWKPTPGVYETPEGAIAQIESELREAETRYREILRDAIPGTKPEWGVNRLRKELSRQGYVMIKPAVRSPGIIYENMATGEQIRIMDRARKRHRNDSNQKHNNKYYYRYRSGDDQKWGGAVTIPDKK